MGIMGFTITVRDDQRTLDLLELFPAKTQQAIDQALEIIGPRVLQDLKDATPVGETGGLKEAWVLFPVDQGMHFVNDKEYATWVEEGTGVFGPRGEPIVPKNAKKLVFIARDGQKIFARSIKGMQERPFIDAAFDEDELVNELGDLIVQGITGDIVS